MDTKAQTQADAVHSICNGLLLVDQSGSSLLTRGNGNNINPGAANTIANRANTLNQLLFNTQLQHPNYKQPTIHIHYSNGNATVKKSEKTKNTLVIYT